jgi:ureidoglycolate hydrolase
LYTATATAPITPRRNVTRTIALASHDIGYQRFLPMTESVNRVVIADPPDATTMSGRRSRLRYVPFFGQHEAYPVEFLGNKT